MLKIMWVQSVSFRMCVMHSLMHFPQGNFFIDGRSIFPGLAKKMSGKKFPILFLNE